MPCSDSNYRIQGECLPDCSARKRLDEVSDMLCRVLRTMDWIDLDPDIQAWTTEHKAFDEQRGEIWE